MFEGIAEMLKDRGQIREPELEELPPIEQACIAPEDDTPLVQDIVMRTTHPAHSLTPITEIIATIHTSTGLAPKRIVLPGQVTAARLADILLGVASW